MRLLPIDKRGPLRKPGDAWNAAFSDYLEEAGCPLVSEKRPYAQTSVLDYLVWLLNHAISLDYEEEAKKRNIDAAAELASGGSSSSSTSARAPVVVSPAADALIKQIATQLNVNTDGRDPLQSLQAIHRAVRHRVIPALAAQERASKAASASSASSAAAASSSSSSSSASASSSAGAGAGSARGASRPGPLPPASELLDLKTFPLGFSTGDVIADKAASVLRMLYITDLRELQDAVNDILVTVQEWTGEILVIFSGVAWSCNNQESLRDYELCSSACPLASHPLIPLQLTQRLTPA